MRSRIYYFASFYFLILAVNGWAQASQLSEELYKKRHWVRQLQERYLSERVSYQTYGSKDDQDELLILDGERAYLVNLSKAVVVLVKSLLLDNVQLLLTRLPNTPKFVNGMTWLGWQIVFKEGKEVRQFIIWRFEQTDH